MSPSPTNPNPTPTKAGRPALSQTMAPTTMAVTAAHDAALHRAIDEARWERRGLLGRLTRVDGG